jgi:hypothetical protein
LGCLSKGNFDGVHHLVPDKTTPVVFSDVDVLLECTRNGTLDASIISGFPEDETGLVTFSSTMVSVHSMFTAEPADTLRLAIDAAIVRALHAQADRIAAANWPPFQYLAVHTCRTDEVDRFPFPDPVDGDRLAEAKSRGALRIASIGGAKWGIDGDYSQDPPVGFWPEFYNAIEEHFKEGTGVGFERVAGSGSVDVMDLVLNGEADATEPYWLMAGYHNDMARQHLFIPSCSTLGYDKTFIVADLNLAIEVAALEAAEAEAAALETAKAEAEAKADAEVEVSRNLKKKITDLEKKLANAEDSGSTSLVVAVIALFVV